MAWHLPRPQQIHPKSAHVRLQGSRHWGTETVSESCLSGAGVVPHLPRRCSRVEEVVGPQVPRMGQTQGVSVFVFPSQKAWANGTRLGLLLGLSCCSLLFRGSASQCATDLDCVGFGDRGGALACIDGVCGQNPSQPACVGEPVSVRCEPSARGPPAMPGTSTPTASRMAAPARCGFPPVGRSRA